MSHHDDVDVAPGTDDRPRSTETFEAVLASRFDRRRFLVRAGLAGAAGAAAGTVGLGGALPVAASSRPGTGPLLAPPPADSLTFTPVAPSAADSIVVPPGYTSSMLIRWGDPIDNVTPAITDADIATGNLATAAIAANQARLFGYNCDAIEYFPIANSSWRGLLCVNHEYTDDQQLFPDWNAFATRADWVAAHPDGVDFAMNAHGITVVRVTRDGGVWRVVKGASQNRRITAFTPIRITGPAAGSDLLQTADDPTGTTVLGTLNNCAGGATPWGTYLSAEENFDQYFGNWSGYLAGTPDPRVQLAHARTPLPNGGSERGWEYRYDRFDAAVEPKEALRFGWVVEVDPDKPNAMPKKRTALGRFKHENAACHLSASNHAVVYSGDDARFEYLYKFVSAGTYTPGNPASGANLLDSGTLYAARFDADGTGEWLPLVFNQGPLTPANGFTSQGDVCIMARRAADLLGATPMDRPEDVQVNPVNGKVYMACTNNTARTDVQTDLPNPRGANRWGHIVEMTEAGGDHTATTFAWEIFILCGDPNSPTGDLLVSMDQLDDLPLNRDHTYFAGYADASKLAPIGSPDNVSFDNLGNLWIVTDGSQPNGVNNGCFVVPVAGPTRGHLRQFLAGPVQAEVCGCEFTPDGTSLFFAIQHPGENGTVAAPTSHWPDGGAAFPRPSTIVVQKPNKRRIGS